MKMKTPMILLISAALACWMPGCGKESSDKGGSSATNAQQKASDTHAHDDGSTHDDHADDMAGDRQHAHDEVSLGPVTVGDMQVELAQGHGAVAAGKEGHLVVKLPYSDNGQSIVRAWIGTKDRTLSMVGKGDYAPSHDDYDIHAIAPDPLPASAMWWIEVEKPDGTKAVGSAKPILE